MNADFRALILADRIAPGSLATVKTDGGALREQVQGAAALLNITGTVSKMGPRRAYLVPDADSVRRYCSFRQPWDHSGMGQITRAREAMITALRVIEPGLRFHVDQGMSGGIMVGT